jgi:hypothetical protein
MAILTDAELVSTLSGRTGPASAATPVGKSISPRRKTLVRQHATEENSPPAHVAMAAAAVSPAGSFCSGGSTEPTTGRKSACSHAVATSPMTTGPAIGNVGPRGNAGRVPPTTNLSISPTGRSSNSSSRTASSSFLVSSPPPPPVSYHRNNIEDSAQLAAAIFTFRTVGGGGISSSSSGVFSRQHHSPTNEDGRGGVYNGGGRYPPSSAVGWRPGYISHSSRALSADCRQHPSDCGGAGSGLDTCSSAGRLVVKRQKTADSAPSRVNSRLSSRQQSLSQGASRVTLIRGMSFDIFLETCKQKD